MISSISIRGHGSPEMITFGNGFITTDWFGNVIDADGNNLTDILRGILIPGAEINLYGCRTAYGDNNISKTLSNTFPGAHVTGYSFYGIGV